MRKRILWIATSLLFGAFVWGTIPTAAGLNSPAVTLGSNPVFSFGGNGYASNVNYSTTLLSENPSLDMRITDIHLSVCCDNYVYGGYVSLSTSGGTTLGQWSLNRDAPVVASMESGLVVPAGEDLVLTAGRNNNGVNVYYTISGQYVRP